MWRCQSAPALLAVIGVGLSQLDRVRRRGPGSCARSMASTGLPSAVCANGHCAQRGEQPMDVHPAARQGGISATVPSPMLCDQLVALRRGGRTTRLRDVTESRAARTASHHGNRHGRSEEARQAVLEAVDDLLVERGFAGVTIEGIAARAGVAKQTIYRWWPSKVDILLEAFTDDMAEHLAPPDLGELGRDLGEHLHNIAEFLTETDPGAVFRALAGHAQHDMTFAVRFRDDCLSQQRTRDRIPFQRAIDRGELPADFDIDLAIDQLLGPLYYRVLVTGEPVTQEFTDHLVHTFVSTRAASSGR
jgi:AcrR family transcriptional regulator